MSNAPRDYFFNRLCVQTRSYFFNLILQGERKMYTSYLTRETFENEHDEKMTRKFSYNYQVLKRLFPEVYKLPESEIRSLVRSIYDNPKLGDELLDHLSDVINKKKSEWGEYLNPKPEEPEQTEQPVQANPLQPVQPKPLNTSSGFEPYKPQKSAFGLDNTNNFGTTGGLNQSQLPNFSKDMDLKHSDMVTGFGINENKQKSLFGTGFQMPKLPKMPTFPKAQEPEQPQMPRFAPTPAPQFQQPALAPYFPQTETAYSTYASQTPMAWAQQAPAQEVIFSDALVDKFYNHIKQPEIEGFVPYMYCDPIGKATVGPGILLTGKADLYDHTITSDQGPVSEYNPALTREQKDALWDRQREFCNSFKHADGTWHVPSAENQIDKYLKMYGVNPPMFNEQELEDEAKHYIRTVALPSIRNKMDKVNKGCFDSFGNIGKIGVGDMEYSMGANKFRLEKCPEDECWRLFTGELEKCNCAGMAQHSHRKNVNEYRNKRIKNFLNRCYDDE